MSRRRIATLATAVTGVAHRRARVRHRRVGPVKVTAAADDASVDVPTGTGGSISVDTQIDRETAEVR